MARRLRGSTGFTGGPVVQLNSSLTGFTTLFTTVQALAGQHVVRASDGTTYLIGASLQTATPQLPFQIGTVTGTVTFPCPGGGNQGVIAAGASDAVIGYGGCGHYWVRTLSSTGAVGPAILLGAAPEPGSGQLGNAWIEVGADAAGRFTAVFTAPGGDLSVARSNDGKTWHVQPGFVPTVNLGTGSDSTLSLGDGSWFASATQTDASGDRFAIEALPLSDTYATPAFPSPAGIPGPRRASLGSLSVIAPGRLSVASFDNNIAVRLLSALADRATTSVTVTRKTGGGIEDVCSGSVVTRLQPGRVTNAIVPCGSGAIVIGGGPGSGTSSNPGVKRGDTVQFTIGFRNGTLTLSSKVS